MSLVFKNVILRLGEMALELDFALNRKVTGLFGRSGSGKTSVLELVAGLRRPEQGLIELDGAPLTNIAQRIFVPARKRAIGYVPQDLALKWFDYWLKEKDNGIMKDPPIRIFVMGANVWRGEHEWPLARTQFTNFYLDSKGKANSLTGDGTLVPRAPGADGSKDTYSYDPANPVFERGGNFSYSIPGVGGSGELSGPHDQRPNERRDECWFTRATRSATTWRSPGR